MTHPRRHRPFIAPALCAALAAITCSLARADSVFWTTDANGAWDDPTNWSSSPDLPGAGSDVTLATPDPISVDLTYDTTTVHSLTLNDALFLDHASLSVATILQLNDNAFLSLSNSTLQNTALTAAPTAALQLANATLANVTLSGSNIQSSGTLTLSGTITNNTTINAYGCATVSNTTTLNGSGTLLLTSTLTGETSAAILNIGPAQTVQISAYPAFSGLTLNNSGTIVSNGYTTAFLDSVTLASNTGTITSTNGGQITLGALSLNNANGTLSALQSLPQHPSILRISSVISGGNLLTDATGQIIFSGGGLANASATGNLLLSNGNVSFRDCTLNGTVSQSGAAVTLNGNITNNATWTQTTTTNNTLYINTPTTLTGNGTLLLKAAVLTCYPTGNTLTLGANQTIQGYGNISPTLTVINNGTLTATTSAFAIQSSFTNNGTAQATSFGTLNFIKDPTNLVNGTLTGGTWSVSGGGGILFHSGVTTNAATLSMSDPNSGFTPLGPLSRNQGSITITNGFAVHTAVNITNTGTFLVGPSSTFTLPQLLMDGGSLRGAGTVAGAVLAGAGPHTIQPGMPDAAAPATFTISSLTTNPQTTLAFRLVAPSVGTAPSSNDQLAITSSLAFNGGTLAVLPQSGALPAPGYYQLLHDPNGFTGSLTSLTLPSAGSPSLVYTLDTSRDPGFIDLHIGHPGDANDDTYIDLNDLNTVLNNLGQTTLKWTDGNFDHAPTIDLNDLNAVLNNLGTTYATNATNATVLEAQSLVAAAPEPASLAPLAVAFALLLHRRKVPHLSKQQLSH